MTVYTGKKAAVDDEAGMHADCTNVQRKFAISRRSFSEVSVIDAVQHICNVEHTGTHRGLLNHDSCDFGCG
jgi:hypothetical protein